MKMNLCEIHDNTASVLAKRRENSDFISFMEQMPHRQNWQGKPQITPGKPAYHYSGTTGQCDGPDSVVFGKGKERQSKFVRIEDWSSEPWTAADRQAFDRHCVQQSEMREQHRKALLAAYAERRKLVKEFTGR